MLNGCANKATRTLINKLTTGLKTDHKLKLIIIHCMFLLVIISTGEYVNKEQISGTQHFSEHIADNSNQPQNYFFFLQLSFRLFLSMAFWRVTDNQLQLALRMDPFCLSALHVFPFTSC